MMDAQHVVLIIGINVYNAKLSLSSHFFCSRKNVFLNVHPDITILNHHARVSEERKY